MRLRLSPLLILLLSPLALGQSDDPSSRLSDRERAFVSGLDLSLRGELGFAGAARGRNSGINREILVEVGKTKIRRARFTTPAAAQAFASKFTYTPGGFPRVVGREPTFPGSVLVEARGRQVVIVEGPDLSDGEALARARKAAWDVLPHAPGAPSLLAGHSRAGRFMEYSDEVKESRDPEVQQALASFQQRVGSQRDGNPERGLVRSGNGRTQGFFAHRDQGIETMKDLASSFLYRSDALQGNEPKLADLGGRPAEPAFDDFSARQRAELRKAAELLARGKDRNDPDVRSHLDKAAAYGAQAESESEEDLRDKQRDEIRKAAELLARGKDRDDPEVHDHLRKAADYGARADSRREDLRDKQRDEIRKAAELLARGKDRDDPEVREHLRRAAAYGAGEDPRQSAAKPKKPKSKGAAGALRDMLRGSK
jgi:hypothetical protein